jgi:hypothetical protein
VMYLLECYRNGLGGFVDANLKRPLASRDPILQRTITISPFVRHTTRVARKLGVSGQPERASFGAVRSEKQL